MSENAETEEKKEIGDDALSKLLMVNAPPEEPEMRSMTIIGDINEELSKDVLAALWFLNHSAKAEELANPDDPECEELREVVKPFEVIISTNGGNADEMFAIYDTMRYIRETVDIETFGLGKVMSAGTLLLAAGTKGKRKIGKSCRVMIHNVAAGNFGNLPNLANELEAIQQLQDDYITAMVTHTKFSRKKLEKLLNEKVNIYLDAEEAVKYGLADEIM